MAQDLKSLIDSHKEIHPSMRAQDVYKLLHQGAMGPHHLVRRQNDARVLLHSEFEALGRPKDKEKLMESVSIDGSVVRINLRVFKRFSRDEGMLFNCMRASAEQMKPDEFLLRSQWNEFKELNEKDLLHFVRSEIAQLEERLETEGFIAIRHSEEYRLQEHPAYRVVLRKCCGELNGFPQCKCQ